MKFSSIMSNKFMLWFMFILTLITIGINIALLDAIRVVIDPGEVYVASDYKPTVKNLYIPHIILSCIVILYCIYILFIFDNKEYIVDDKFIVLIGAGGIISTILFITNIIKYQKAKKKL